LAWEYNVNGLRHFISFFKFKFHFMRQLEPVQ